MAGRATPGPKVKEENNCCYEGRFTYRQLCYSVCIALNIDG